MFEAESGTDVATVIKQNKVRIQLILGLVTY